jgi:uncharacterized membrane protein
VTLVTIDLGANDVTVCEAITSDHCTGAGEIAELRNEVTTGLTTVLRDLRSTGYRGRLVVLTYYATTPAELPVATALDAVLTAVAGHAGAEVADGLTAFSSAHGDACRAGLLIALPAGGCDIHPTLRGQQLLAAAVEAAAHA